MSENLQRAAKSLTIIVLVALSVRLIFLWNYASHNPARALSTVPFLFESGNIAHSLAAGHGFASPFRVDTGPTAWMTPVYPLLLAGIFRVFGQYTFAGFIAAALLNIFATTFATIPIYYAGEKVAGVWVGAGAAWLWAVFPNAFQIPAESMWDASLAALLTAIVLWATLRLGDSASVTQWIGYGILWGFSLMTNAALASLLPVTLLWLAYRRRRIGREWLRRPLLALSVVALCCVPWTVRNYEVFHAFVPLRSILGLQLWVGNNPNAQDRWLGSQHPIHDADERAKYVEMGEIAYMNEKRDAAIEYIANHPTREVDLIWHRVVAVWSGGTPNPLRDFVRTNSNWFRFVLCFNLLATLGTVGGIVLLIRKRDESWPLFAAIPIVFPCAYYLTVAEPRYRLPIDPVVMLLTAITISSIMNAAAGSMGRKRAVAHSTGESENSWLD